VSTPPFLQLPAGVESVRIGTGRGEFAALDNRDAVSEPVLGSALLVPGFTGSKEDFIAILGPLGERGVRAIAYDQRGQYETADEDEQGVHSLRAFAVDAIALSATLPRPLVLVGHSFGGLVVREALACDPDVADGIALMSSGCGAVPEGQRPLLRRFAEMMNQHGLPAVLNAKRSLEAATGAPALPPEIDAFLDQRFVSNSPASLSAMIDVLCEQPDNVVELGNKAVDAVVIVGVRDDVWSPAEQHDLATRLGARVVDIAAAGHSPAVESPEATVSALLELYRVPR
jgi:pimeloyl-ACP methyl ester carboxylesterase